MTCKPDARRAWDDIPLQLGEVLTCEQGIRHVFIGWRSNSVGPFPVFVKEQIGEIARDGWANTVHIYKASVTETVVRKFPELAARVRP